MRLVKRSFPDEILTERLCISMPRYAAAEELHRAILESLPELQPWLAWARQAPSLRYIETYLLEGRRRFDAKEEFPLLLLCRESGRVLGGSGIHQVDWSVPRGEIGYWLRSADCGRGLMTEALTAIIAEAFYGLGMQRVEIRTSALNQRSARLAERLGFRLEGTLKNDRREREGQLSDTLLYAKTVD